MVDSKVEYEAVIGLEVHVQIKTRSKMFAAVEAGFGHEPNNLTDPVIIGLPGVLPVMNKEAIDKTIATGLMFNCTIAEVCKWDRKHYFYPDSAKNYQISQYDQPICIGGEIEIELPGPARNTMGAHRTVRLARIHLEEDVGKLNHFSSDSLVDFNRAGTPLMEIVSEPDLFSSDEAFAYLTALRQAIVGVGISDCDMEKGQLRCDANISVRPVGSETLGTKVELKNLNSISGVRNGVEYEVRRQIAATRRGETIVQETRRWDADTNVTTSMRTKEMAHDYRYFPDPDLMPVVIDEAWRESIRAQLPEMPFDRQRRLMAVYDLPYTITSVLVVDRDLAEFFEEAVGDEADRALSVGKWVTNDLLREMADASIGVSELKIGAGQLRDLVGLVERGVVSSSQAREVFSEMFVTGDGPEAIIERRGMKQSTDTGELEVWCREAIAARPKSVADYRSGNEKALNALKGPVMKASRGKANPRMVDEILRRLLAD
jgi:aspartyl-tRNA(Asn)/glutamyl-tRNA(Gln) amidotransferase subunit B